VKKGSAIRQEGRGYQRQENQLHPPLHRFAFRPVHRRAPIQELRISEFSSASPWIGLQTSVLAETPRLGRELARERNRAGSAARAQR
jgi:hypothetical protein